jgi:hypothetical protein
VLSILRSKDFFSKKIILLFPKTMFGIAIRWRDGGHKVITCEKGNQFIPTISPSHPNTKQILKVLHKSR